MRYLAVLIWACALQAQTHENLNAILWMQQSAEYRANAMQTYRAATANLDRALKEKSWTAAPEQTGRFHDLPPAVVLDLDETVVDNSAYQARMLLSAKQHSEPDWAQWVGEKRAGLIPGAVQFLLAAHAKGVAAVYVTNRVCDPTRADDPTLQMARMLQLPIAPDRLLCKTKAADPSDKSPRRALAASKYRILMLIGDDLNDFVTVGKEGRAPAVDAFRDYWGERWFMLPNPSYGSWERAVGYDVAVKRHTLKP